MSLLKSLRNWISLEISPSTVVINVGYELYFNADSEVMTVTVKIPILEGKMDGLVRMYLVFSAGPSTFRLPLR